MDKHPFEIWNQFVHSMLHPAVLLQSAPDAIDGYLVIAKELKEALSMQLLRDTLYNKTETETGLLVERYQTLSADLLNLLFHTRQTEILRFFATHFTTLHKSEFSYGHLQSKYYDVDERTKKKVNDYLMEMVNLCKKL
jgi:hypothetical protein